MNKENLIKKTNLGKELLYVDYLKESQILRARINALIVKIKIDAHMELESQTPFKTNYEGRIKMIDNLHVLINQNLNFVDELITKFPMPKPKEDK